MVLDPVHDQCTGGRTVAHIIEVRIDTGYGVVVWNVVGRVIGVRMLFLRRGHLVRQAGHFPAGGIVIRIVGADLHIAPGHVHRGQIVHDLLFITGQGHLDLLGHAGRQQGTGAGEHGVVGVLHLILGRQIQIVRKGIAARLPQIRICGAIQVGPLQRADALVRTIGIVNGVPNVLLRRNPVEPVFQEELDTQGVSQIRCEVILHCAVNTGAARNLFQNVKCVQISIQVRSAKGVGRIRAVPKEILIRAGADLLRHLLHGAGNTGIGRQLYQVTNIAGPTAQIRSALIARVIGHIHGTKHMGKLHGIPIGQGKRIQITQTAGMGAVGCVLLRNILGKFCLFRSTECRPAAGGVSTHAAANIVDDQGSATFLRMLQRVSLRITLQVRQIRHKVAELRHHIGRIHFRLPFAGGLCLGRRRILRILFFSARLQRFGSRLLYGFQSRFLRDFPDGRFRDCRRRILRL